MGGGLRTRFEPPSLPVDDPKKLKHQKPDYVEDLSGTGDPDHQPQIGTDPMTTSETSVHKTIVAPDPEKVRAHDRERARRREQEG